MNIGTNSNLDIGMNIYVYTHMLEVIKPVELIIKRLSPQDYGEAFEEGDIIGTALRGPERGIWCLSNREDGFFLDEGKGKA